MPQKSTLEKSFDQIGVKPVARHRVYGYDILFGDGFVAKPYPALKKFGVEEGEFPHGCYVTCWLWHTEDDKVGLGLPIFFDPMHDISQPLNWRRERRIDEAKMSAIFTIRELKKARKKYAH